MRFLLVLLVFSLTVLSMQAQQAWQVATKLPNVDFAGLTPAQQQTALKVLRDEGCTCQCDMKLAQCRVMDPNCSESRALAALVVKSVREGKSAGQIRDALAKSAVALHHAGPGRVLDDPVEIPVAGSPVKGPKDAKITLVEFSDFECPYCSKAVGQIDAVLRAYPRDVKLIYKQFPLAMHPHANLAAEASLAAFAQGKFWPMHDKLFAHFHAITRENVMLWAKEIGLDTGKFATDLDAIKYTHVIEKDTADGEAAGVNGTPTIFIDGKHYNGSLAIDAMKPIIDAELKGK
ncbi:MAG: thioredoxin domain-containing protein [Acidobacteriota bacterium]|nr:thioredoxin domain-containing protein [Acidobacteriota bacterium]